MIDLFENVWGSQKEIAVDHAVDSITLPVSSVIMFKVYTCLLWFDYKDRFIRH